MEPVRGRVPNCWESIRSQDSLEVRDGVSTHLQRVSDGDTRQENEGTDGIETSPY